MPKIAERLKIHISTAFYWRHKILNALGSLGFHQLQGIVESDETFFRESMKGREVTIEMQRNVVRKTIREAFLTLKLQLL